jgi:hypothetical protein
MAGADRKENSNTAALEYLRRYCDQKNEFDYAVMIRGKWGAGKTHLINNFIIERKTQGFEKNLYVSLYGLTSGRQIDEALYRQLHPVLSSRGMKLAATIGKGLLKAITKIDIGGDGKEDITLSSSIPDVDLSEYFKTPKECLLIFDDLERCSMKVSDILGYINSFVEHEGFKAIIIANEVEILKREDKLYAEIKEKLIGQTLTVQSTIEDALAHFLTLIGDAKSKEYLTSRVDEIRLLHSQSGTDNLRLLKQALWDFERLGFCLTETHWKNDEAVGILFRNVLALSFEARAGHLNEEQLLAVATESSIRLFKKETDAPTFADELKKKYPEVEFAQRILSPAWMRKLLFDGWVDADETRVMLNQSPYFASPQTLPAWKVAWHGWEISDNDYEEAVAKVEKQFDDRTIVVIGEIFQVFGIRLFASDVGVIVKTRKQVVDECKLYLDDLKKLGRFPDPLLSDRKEMGGSWEGLGFIEADRPEFREIVEHFDATSAAVLKQSLPAKGRELLVVMKRDVQEFFRQLCLNNVTPSPYFDVPVLASIDPEGFVDNVLALAPDAQSSVFSMFIGRYDRGQLDRELMEEKAWILAVKSAFEKRMPALGKMTRHRLKNQIGHSYGKFLPPSVDSEAKRRP